MVDGRAIALSYDNWEPGVRNPRLKAEVGLIQLSVKYYIINYVANHNLEYAM